MKKKTLALLLSAALCVGMLAGCGGSGGGSAGTPAPETSAPETSAPETQAPGRAVRHCEHQRLHLYGKGDGAP